MAVLLLHFINLLCFLRFLSFQRIPAHFSKFFRHDKDWLIFTQALKTMPCDVTFLAEFSQLFMHSAGKLRTHIVP